MHFFTWVKQLKRWWGDDDDEGYTGEDEYREQGFAEISYGFGSIFVCVCVCGRTHNIDIVLNDFISARRRKREGGRWGETLHGYMNIFVSVSLSLSLSLCVCRACCIRICSIMTQITSAHCLLRAVQVDITTRRVYVICWYSYLCCFFFLFSYFLCFCLFRAKKRPLWWLAKLVRISFHVHPQGVCMKQDLLTLTHSTRIHIYTSPHPQPHTRHMLLVQWFSRRNAATKK